MSNFSIKRCPSVGGPRCYSHRSLNELHLRLCLPAGVQEAASDSQSGAGLRRVELNDGQRQRGQDRRAEEDSRAAFTRVLLNIYSISIAIMLMQRKKKKQNTPHGGHFGSAQTMNSVTFTECMKTGLSASFTV